MAGRRRAAVRRRPCALPVLLPLALVATTGWGLASAAFTAASTSDATWRGGTVSLSSDASATVPLAVADLRPGSTGSTCVTVTSTADVPTSVRLYAASTSGALAPSLSWAVDTVGTAGACADRPATGTVVAATTLSAWGAAAADWASGTGSWTAAPTSSLTYRVTWRLTPGNGSAGRSAATTLVWEARTA